MGKVPSEGWYFAPFAQIGHPVAHFELFPSSTRWLGLLEGDVVLRWFGSGVEPLACVEGGWEAPP